MGNVVLKTKIVYFVLALIVTLQLFGGKYLFLLDCTPAVSKNMIWKHFYGFTTPIYGGALPINLLCALIPPEIFQKLIIFLILFLSGVSMDSLAGRFTNSNLSRLYAGILYMINPFTYIRIVVGHWILLLSYSFLPLAILFFIEMLEKCDIRSIVKFVLLETLVAFSAHILLISVIIYAIILAFKLNLSTLKSVLIAILLFIPLNSYWLIPVLTLHKGTVLAHISLKDLKAFAPRGTLFELMAMYGFWRFGYIYPKDFLYPYWMYMFLIIFGLSILGFAKRRSYALPFMIIWLVGFALAAGIKGPLSSLLTPLFKNTILKGMRDSQKFVTMLALSYSFLGALGIDVIKRRVRWIVLVVLIVLPLIYSFTFFNCFAGQIKPGDFPKDWYQVKAFLDRDKDNFRILFFPWHLYMWFHWVPDTNKLIANPAPLFFDKDVISGKNIEIPGVYTEVYTPYQVYIDKLLRERNRIKNFGKLVSVIGVKYILLTKEADYKEYEFLFHQKDLKLVMETENFYVFKNLDFKGLAFTLDSYPDLNNISNCQRVELKELNPAHFEIEGKTSKYLVYTQEYSEFWKLDGEKPFKAFGVVCGYVLNGGRNIIYERFYRVYLPSYIVSVLALVAYLVLWRFRP